MTTDAIPAGSKPPEKQDTAKEEPKQKEELILGKYKSMEELAKAHESLQTKLGEQGNALGELRQQNQQVMSQLDQMRQAAQKTEEPETDYEAQMADIYRRMDEGEISESEAFKTANNLTAAMVREQTLSESEQRFQKILQERDAQSVQQQFLKDNPDFEELRTSGALDAVKQSNSMHDDFSAYYALKAQRAKEEGLAEATRLKEGEEVTKKVLTKPGAAIRQRNRTPMSEAEQKASMLAALERTGAG